MENQRIETKTTFEWAHKKWKLIRYKKLTGWCERWETKTEETKPERFKKKKKRKLQWMKTRGIGIGIETRERENIK